MWNQLPKDGNVGRHQIRSRLPWSLVETSRDYHDGCGGAVGILTSPNMSLVREWSRMVQVHSLSLCLLLIHIYQYNFGGQSAEEEPVCSGGADIANSNDSNLYRLELFSALVVITKTENMSRTLRLRV